MIRSAAYSSDQPNLTLRAGVSSLTLELREGALSRVLQLGV